MEGGGGSKGKEIHVNVLEFRTTYKDGTYKLLTKEDELFDISAVMTNHKYFQQQLISHQYSYRLS